MTEPDRLRRILRDLDVAYSEDRFALDGEPEPWVSFIIEGACGCPTVLEWWGEPRCDEYGLVHRGWDGRETLPELLLAHLGSLRRHGRRSDYDVLLRILNAALRWEDGDDDG